MYTYGIFGTKTCMQRKTKSNAVGKCENQGKRQTMKREKNQIRYRIFSISWESVFNLLQHAIKSSSQENPFRFYELKLNFVWILSDKLTNLSKPNTIYVIFQCSFNKHLSCTSELLSQEAFIKVLMIYFYLLSAEMRPKLNTQYLLILILILRLINYCCFIHELFLQNQKTVIFRDNFVWF